MYEVDSLRSILKTRALCEDDDRCVLFHGTRIYFETIDLLQTKSSSDFGRGFYLTNILEQAVEWAGNRRKENIKAKYTQYSNIVIPQYQDAYVFKYEVSFDILEQLGLKFKIFEDYNIEWLDMILLGRRHLDKNENHIWDINNYFGDNDIIAGPMADSGLMDKLNKYEETPKNERNRNRLLEEIKMERKNYQVVFRTEKSLKALNRLGDDIKF